ncbi:MAG TPA: N-acetylmuramoyl-L-alanine amidase [Candidatus Acidoferrum sp.]|nr:N-acetylmuramoyl-L-alanine amidase [Candidatus Acidoferrum sp.]
MSASSRVSGGILFGFFFNRGFARLSPVFAVAALSAALAAAVASAAFASDGSGHSSETASAEPGAAERRQAASSQFAHAEEQRAALNNKPPDKRTLNEYKQVVSSYRRVYLITPHAAEVPDSLLAVAELYTEMGDRFGRAYYQSAVDSYQFLMREYPTSRYLQDAYLRSAKLQKDQLGDTAGASKTYDAFLKKFPHSKQRREAQEARAELALLQRSAPPDAKQNAIARSTGSDSARETRPPVISRDVAKDFPKDAPRSAAKEAAPEEAGSADDDQPVAAGGKIPQIRRISAQAAADSTRVTIEIESSVQYVSGRVANPDRIYFDLHAARLAQPLLHKKIEADGPLVAAIRTSQSANGVVRVVLEVNGVIDYSASLLNSKKDGASQLVIDLYADVKPVETRTAEAKVPAKDTASGAANPPPKNAIADKAQPAAASKSAKADTTDAPAAVPIPEPKRTLASAKSGKKPDLVQPASAPQPTRDGQSTLTRALGLKIGRIVIDAGHGGHDTGTIGPTGLMEKDLCLDVALRLGKIIQQRLPSADVVFTRSDDTFIPLEERTHIANEAKADMFVSIHANSSQDTAARGIETYYLNLKGSPEAMEVAARENATSDQGIHELEDLVKQIARTEKIDESREFAEDVQDSLSKRVQKTAKVVKNRGVRKAPFVVLIGADMPSILTEISFLSNPADERLLKQPEHRQRVAEGIFQGIAGYLQSLNSMTVNQSNSPVARKTTTSASAGEASRNRN